MSTALLPPGFPTAFAEFADEWLRYIVRTEKRYVGYDPQRWQDDVLAIFWADVADALADPAEFMRTWETS